VHSSSSPTLSIDANVLSVGVRYNVTVLATWRNTTTYSFADSVVVETRTWEDVCSGCSLTLSISGGPVHVTGAGQMVTLYPQLVDLDSVSGAPAQYAWSCVSASVGGPCLSAVAHVPLGLHSLTNSSSGIVTIPGGSLGPGNYTLTVTVTKGVVGGLLPHHYRTTNATALLMVVPAPALRVTIARPAAARATVNPGHGVTLEGIVEDPRGGSAGVISTSWVQESVISGSGYASSLLTQLDDSRPSLVFARVPLTVLPGTSYTFTLVATGVGVAPGSASVVVVVNGPPTGGMVSAWPLSVPALTSPVTLTTYGWADALQVGGCTCRHDHGSIKGCTT
jgi:hypothetical protein